MAILKKRNAQGRDKSPGLSFRKLRFCSISDNKSIIGKSFPNFGG